MDEFCALHGPDCLSADAVEAQDRGISMFDSMHSVEYMNQLKWSRLPNHEFKLKVGVPVMLMRNINLSEGLCNVTRFVITKLGDYVVEGQVIGGNNHGDIVLIPRMTLYPSDCKLPFKFKRRQFSLIRAYDMTINKSQGLSLSTVGVFLKKHVFAPWATLCSCIKNNNQKMPKVLMLRPRRKRDE